MADMPMVVLKNVSKQYGRGAIGAKDVSLTVEVGEMVALFGPSGSGKTSILHIMGLLQSADAGEVWLDGSRMDGISERAAAAIRRKALGFVFQSFGLLPLLSATENVTVSMRLLGIGGETARRKVADALEVVDLTPRAAHRPGEMSGGEQQRVAIARAIVHSPKLLLADEPTGELDTNTAAYMLGMLQQISRDGAAVVLATHDPAALEWVDRAYFVRDGTLHEPDRDELELWLTEGESGGAMREERRSAVEAVREYQDAERRARQIRAEQFLAEADALSEEIAHDLEDLEQEPEPGPEAVPGPPPGEPPPLPEEPPPVPGDDGDDPDAMFRPPA
jgi:putative ABC transport system ATP-binding protein